MDNDALWSALTRVKIDAQNYLETNQIALLGAPLFGWTSEKHEAYYLKRIAECRAVIRYCEIRQMQINPD